MALDRSSETIFALATPLGRSALAVLRISGPKSIPIVRRLARFLPVEVESHRVYYGHLQSILDSEVILDEVLLTAFLGKKSFTGEESVEISCHGNPVIIDEIQRELVTAGAVPAQPGEFTFRAFMNGRLDLVQAESVLSVIESQSPFEKTNALKQLGGELSEAVAGLEKQLLRTLAHVEADIDFSTEGLETMPQGQLVKQLEEVLGGLCSILEGYRRGRLLNEGFRVVFAGPPNVGKSSLLNLVVGQDRAIVTEIAGTTRDTIESWTDIGGIRVSWVDTAGLRDTSDRVEQLGIARVRSYLKKCDLVFWVLATDVAMGEEVEDLKWLIEERPEVLVVVENKSDLLTDKGGESVRSAVGLLSDLGMEIPTVRGSTVVNAGAFRDELVGLVRSKISDTGAADTAVISRARHFDSLQAAQNALLEAVALARDGISRDILAMPMKEALIQIQAVLGIRYDEQIIDQIFKEFCLGK